MKIVGIICAVSWAIAAVGLLFPNAGSAGHEVEGQVFGSAMGVGIALIPALIIMALINYARRK